MMQFYNYFSNYIDSGIMSQIGMGEIVSLKIRRDSRYVEIGLFLDTVVDHSIIVSAQNSICQNMELKKVVIKTYYPQSAFELDNIEQIVKPLITEYPIVNGFFNDAEAELEDDIITIFLKKGGKDVLEAQGIHKAISQLIYDSFKLDYDVSFLEVQAFDMEQAVKEAVEKRQAEENRIKEEKAKNVVHKQYGNLPLYEDTRKVVFGR